MKYNKMFLSLMAAMLFTTGCATYYAKDGNEKRAELSGDKELQSLYQQRDSLRSKSYYFNREAQRLMFLDFLASRNYSIMAERCQDKLNEVEQQIKECEAKTPLNKK